MSEYEEFKSELSTHQEEKEDNRGVTYFIVGLMIFFILILPVLLYFLGSPQTEDEGNGYTL